MNGSLPRGRFAEPRVFPRSTPAADEFPSEETGFVVRGERIVEVWVNLLAAILAFGRRDLTAYTVQQRELLDVVATIQNEDPEEFYLPEWLPLTREQLDAYYPQLLTSQRTGEYCVHVRRAAIRFQRTRPGECDGRRTARNALLAPRGGRAVGSGARREFCRPAVPQPGAGARPRRQIVPDGVFPQPRYLSARG